jgi:hypothetical protein
MELTMWLRSMIVAIAPIMGMWLGGIMVPFAPASDGTNMFARGDVLCFSGEYLTPFGTVVLHPPGLIDRT